MKSPEASDASNIAPSARESEPEGKAKPLLLGLLIALICFELLSFLFFNLFKSRFVFFDPSNYLLSKRHLQEFAKNYDRELGWKMTSNESLGERQRKIKYQKPFMASFGDSFTYCDQVGSDQSWQSFLSTRARMDIYNFGGSGYGTDQALMRFRQVMPKLKVPVVSLGLITENVNRALNRYRRFYFIRNTSLVVKPRFEVKEGKLSLIENPIKTADELPKLLNPEYLEEIGEKDWWYNRNDLPRLQFPFSVIWFHKRLWQEALYRYRGQTSDDINPRPWEDTWDYPEARELIYAIFDAFVTEAKQYGSTPVILISPRQGDIIEKMRGSTPKAVKYIMDYCELKKYLCFDGVSAFASIIRKEENVPKLYNGHLTARGNSMFGMQVGKFLQAHGLISAEVDLSPPKKKKRQNHKPHKFTLSSP